MKFTYRIYPGELHLEGLHARLNLTKKQEREDAKMLVGLIQIAACGGRTMPEQFLSREQRSQVPNRGVSVRCTFDDKNPLLAPLLGELSAMATDQERVAHVKKLLRQLCENTEVQNAAPKQGLSGSTQASPPAQSLIAVSSPAPQPQGTATAITFEGQNQGDEDAPPKGMTKEQDAAWRAARRRKANRNFKQ